MTIILIIAFVIFCFAADAETKATRRRLDALEQRDAPPFDDGY